MTNAPDSPLDTASSSLAPPPHRVVLGGFLMGLANLVPGVSGGTMILAVGLYDRFISAVAELSSLRWSKGMFLFLFLLAAGLGVALIGLAGPAVHMVTHYRWAMYSLFVGMTLGGAPELLRLAFPKPAYGDADANKSEDKSSATIAMVLGFALMAWIAWSLQGVSLPHTFMAFMMMGVVAASSMILPGVSGSYLLLIFGVYDVVIGSLSSSALKEDLKGSLMIIGPVVIGAAIGIALLSNVLKVVLSRYSKPAHGALLGLLLGSVLGLWPFQEARYPELLDKPLRKEIAAEIATAGTWQPAFASRSIELDEVDGAKLTKAIESGTARGGVKSLASVTERYSPDFTGVLKVLALFAFGFALVRRLAPKRAS
ncbi:MAG: putative membrane protein [Planctomycetota bacterium]